jgi:hypothetical protein
MVIVERTQALVLAPRVAQADGLAYQGNDIDRAFYGG